MRQFSRRAELFLIGGAFVVISVGVWALGRVFDAPLLSFSGLMVLASTFVPLPADAYVVQTAETLDPIMVAVVGGLINAFAVLGERLFILRLIDYPIFERLKRFVGTNKFLGVLDDQMFLGLAIAAASPIPFEVFRFVAVTRNVNLVTYFFATLIGRGGRFYVLAVAGGWFAAQGILPHVVAFLLVLFALGVVRSLRNLKEDDDQIRGTEQA